MIGGKEASLLFIQLRAEINETAQIDLIHFRDDNRIIFSQKADITNCKIEDTFMCPRTVIKGGLALCVRVKFLPGDSRGMVIFLGAGGTFELE